MNPINQANQLKWLQNSSFNCTVCTVNATKKYVGTCVQGRMCMCNSIKNKSTKQRINNQEPNVLVKTSSLPKFCHAHMTYLTLKWELDWWAHSGGALLVPSLASLSHPPHSTSPPTQPNEVKQEIHLRSFVSLQFVDHDVGWSVTLNTTPSLDYNGLILYSFCCCCTKKSTKYNFTNSPWIKWHDSKSC